jgi:hypothetical protein
VTVYNAPQWADKPRARRDWADAPADDARLDDLLTAATDACRAYAPTRDAAFVIPVGWTTATVYQAREIYNAATRDGQDVIGFGDYAIRARPLPDAVKSLLRPQRAFGAMG